MQQFRIFDLSAKQIFEQKTFAQKNFQINIQNLSSGMYLVKVIGEDQIEIKRIVIE
ncbi:MAG: T9SS type A sorting domain-containing protein [Schleiferiaceae bacterium]|nr:T9SS type A sorting domain-containing protein [Schleiferiaceae bacterium]